MGTISWHLRYSCGKFHVAAKALKLITCTRVVVRYVVALPLGNHAPMLRWVAAHGVGACALCDVFHVCAACISEVNAIGGMQGRIAAMPHVGTVIAIYVLTVVGIGSKLLQCSLVVCLFQSGRMWWHTWQLCLCNAHLALVPTPGQSPHSQSVCGASASGY